MGPALDGQGAFVSLTGILPDSGQWQTTAAGREDSTCRMSMGTS
jgi:hypothetical protein